MKYTLDIDTKTFIRFWLVVIGFALIALSIYISLPALMIVGTALFLAIALNPPVSKIANMLPSKSRVLSTALAFVAVILILGAVIFLVVPPVVQQTSKFIQTVPSLLDSATTQYSGFKEFVDRYGLQPQVNEVVTSIKAGATQFASGIGTNLIAGIGSILSVITTTVVVLVLTFLMLVEGPVWVARLWELYNDKDLMSHHRSTVKKMYSVVTGYVSGQLTVAAIAGLTAGITVFILSLFFGTPANLAIPTAAIIFVLSLIPFFGAIIGAVLMSFVLAINSPIAALIFFIYFIVYQQVEGNYIGPKIQSKRLDLSPLFILVSIVIGIVLFGIAGGIISIPVAGCVKILVDNYIERNRKKNSDLKTA